LISLFLSFFSFLPEDFKIKVNLAVNITIKKRKKKKKEKKFKKT